MAGARNDIVEVTRRGLRWELDLREGIDLAIFLRVFESSTVRAYGRLLKPDDVVLDIGANIGAHTLQFARLVGPKGRVYAFEPTAFAFAKLRRNIDLNPPLRARIMADQVMLSDRDDSLLDAEIYSSWPVVSESNLHPKHGGRYQSTKGARVSTLDAYLVASGVRKVDFIKMDVDGFECHVLAGGIKSLAAYKPIILMELSPYVLVEHGRSVDELLSLLASAGYRLSSLSGRGLASDPKLLNAAVPEGSGFNVIARCEQ